MYMYDVDCIGRDDTISFTNMSYTNVLELLDDFGISYQLDIKNTRTGKKYKITGKDAREFFEKEEGKNKEVE